jgi:hypothetical protein
MRLELARQLEYLIADTLEDRSQLVPAFLMALRMQLEAVHATDQVGTTYAEAEVEAETEWAALHELRPSGVDRFVWSGMFEFVACRMLRLLGPHQVLAFVCDLCDGARFAQLKLGGMPALESRSRG